jgi:zinc transport system substrate-binding protein
MTISGAAAARRLAAAFAAACVALGGCAQSTPPSDDAGPSVLVSFYPLQFLAERIAGPDAVVSSLTPPGAEPHDLELSPAQVAEVGRADLVVYISGFQPAVDEAIAARAPAHVVDAATVTTLMPLASGEPGHTDGDACASPGEDGTEVCEAPDPEAGQASGPLDPHFWLDPTRMEGVATAIAEALDAIDPPGGSTYEANRDAVKEDLAALDSQFEQGLGQCARRTIVATHAAFGYLAARYGLTQLSVGGIDPDAEPSPARIREVSAALDGTGVTTVFFESQASPDIAEALAATAGLSTAVLDPLEATADGDYLTRMDTNLATLRTALDCS